MLGLWSLGTAPLGLTLHLAFDVALDGLSHASEQSVLADLHLDSMSQLLLSSPFIRFCCSLHLFYLNELIDLHKTKGGCETSHAISSDLALYVENGRYSQILYILIQ